MRARPKCIVQSIGKTTLVTSTLNLAKSLDNTIFNPLHIYWDSFQIPDIPLNKDIGYWISEAK